MNTIIIEKKEYVVIPKKEYEQLLNKATSKAAPLTKRLPDEGKKPVYKPNIKLEKKSTLDEIFGLWKNEKVTLEQIRGKAWQRTK